MSKKSKVNDSLIIKKCLSNIDAIKRFANETQVEPEFLKHAAQLLNQAATDIEDEIELKKLEAEEKEKERLNLINIIESKGWSVEELLNYSLLNNIPKAAIKKYSFTDDKGQIKYWSGRGKMPVVLKKLIENGAVLDDFLIRRKKIYKCD